MSLITVLFRPKPPFFQYSDTKSAFLSRRRINSIPGEPRTWLSAAKDNWGKGGLGAVHQPGKAFKAFQALNKGNISDNGKEW